jgi:PAS domain S-box-containing protein
MQWLEHSIHHKFIAGTASGLLISSAVFLVLYIGLYQQQLAAERSQVAVQVNNLLQSTLENAMLKRDLEGLRQIVNRLGQQPGMTSVIITNPRGEIRFSSDPTRLETWLPVSETFEPATHFVTDPEGHEILRSINPVHNKAPCTQCHGSVDLQPVNGILYVDYDATPIRVKARNTTLLLMGSGALIVLINLAGGWWFIRRYVIKPVDRLATASAALSQGDLHIRAGIQGRDELAQLGQTFDIMAENLQDKVEALKENQQFLQALVDATPDGLRVIDSNYLIRLANRAYEEHLGLPVGSAVGSTCHVSAHNLETPCPSPLITCPLQEVLANDQPVKVVHRHQRTDGSYIDVEIYAAPMRVASGGESQTLIVESIRDLTTEVRFSHEQRLSELGRLAAGVAHEIHNPLASVRLGLHAVERTVADSSQPPESVKNYLELVDHEVDKCIQVTERLLKLSMPPASTPELVAVKDAVGETLSLLYWEASEAGIRLSETYQPEDIRVLAADSDLRMAALNLAQNAFHAMPDGGSLRISAWRADGEIFICFEDSGQGIPAEFLTRIFDPFFSRRADGARGTGLGLSITRALVENHGGRLEVESTPGEGSRFTIRMPDPMVTNENTR